jgi:hypothetical protein
VRGLTAKKTLRPNAQFATVQALQKEFQASQQLFEPTVIFHQFGLIGL